MNVRGLIVCLLLPLGAFAQPANDCFTNRIVITGTNYQWFGDNTDATTEPGEPAIGGTHYYTGSLWWTWTAPFSGVATIDVSGSANLTIIGIYDGETLSNLVTVAGSSSGQVTPVRLRVLNGETIQIATASVSQPGPTHLALSFLVPPPNDDFTNRIQLTGLSNVVTGTLLGATVEPDEPAGQGNSVWWQWRAPLNGRAIFSKPDWGSSVTIFRGTSLTNLISLFQFNPWMQFDVIGGEDYVVCVNSAPDTAPFTFSIIEQPSAPNDSFDRRIRLSGVTNRLFNAPGSAARWWAWTAPENGDLTFIADYGDVAFFTGTSQTNLTAATNITAPGSAWTLRVTRGQEYVLRWLPSGSSTSSGSLTFRPAPGNDAFTNAYVLSGASGTTNGTTAAATREPGEPGSGSRTVWYAWTAPTNGQVTFQLRDSWQPRIAVYTNNTLATLAPVYGATSLAQFFCTAGTTYRIQVQNTSGDPAFSFFWQLLPIPPNSTFETRLPLVATNPVQTRTAPNGETWFSWRAPTNCLAAMTLLTSSSGNQVSVYTGSVASALFQIWSSYITGTSNMTAFLASAGVDYAIRCTANFGSTVEVLLTTTLPSTNDRFADRTPLVLGTNFGSNAVAFREPDEPHHISSLDYQSVWHSWIAPSSGPVTLYLVTTNAGTGLVVYRGTQLTNLVRVTTNDYRLSDTVSRASFNAVAGTEYTIAIALTYGLGGPYELLLSRDAMPALSWVSPTSLILTQGADVTFEADASDADGAVTQVQFLSGSNVVASFSEPPYRLTFSNVTLGRYALSARATDNAGNITVLSELAAHVPPANTEWSNRVSFTNAVTTPPGTSSGADGWTWWSWVAPSNGSVTISASVGSSATYIQVNVITNGTSLLQVASAQSPLTFATAESVEYVIRLITSPGEPGAVSLAITPAAANDMFASRISVSGDSNSLAGDFRFASAEPGEPPHWLVASLNSLWWSWTAPATGIAIVWWTNAPSLASYDIYRGTNITNLTRITGSSSSSGASKATFPVQAGEQFEIAAVGYSYYPSNFVLHVDWLPLATNDAFANRVFLTGATNIVSSANFLATTEPGEPDGSKSLWWSWAAPRSGRVLVKLSTPTHWVNIYTGSVLGALSSVASRAIAFQAIAGVTYQLQVGSYDWQPGDFTFSLEQALPPPNDDRADAPLLTGYPTNVPGTTWNASPESFEYSGFAHSVWWYWTAPDTRSVTVVAPDAARLVVHANDYYASQITVAPPGSATFTATAGATYLIELNDPTDRTNEVSFSIVPNSPPQLLLQLPANRQSFAPGELIPILVQALDAGGTVTNVSFDEVPITGMLTNTPFFVNMSALSLGSYYVYATASDNLGAITSAELFINIAEANDAFASATSLNGDSVDAFANVTGATREPGEPQFGNTLWWRWTAPRTGTFIISTDGSDADTSLNVCLGNSVSNLLVVASNEDVSWFDLRSEVQLAATSGTEYRIVISARGLTSGNVRLRIRPKLSNDDWSSAEPISGLPFTTTTVNDGATRESAEPFHAYAAGMRSLWWRWTATTNGTVALSTSGSSFATLLAVYSGNALSSLVPVASRANYAASDDSTLIFNATAGTTYSIAIDGFASATGTLRLIVANAGGGTLFQPRRTGNALTLDAFIPLSGVAQLQRSTNLVNWTTVNPLPGTNGLRSVQIPIDSAAQNFFRIVQP